MQQKNYIQVDMICVYPMRLVHAARRMFRCRSEIETNETSTDMTYVCMHTMAETNQSREAQMHVPCISEESEFELHHLGHRQVLTSSQTISNRLCRR